MNNKLLKKRGKIFKTFMNMAKDLKALKVETDKEKAISEKLIAQEQANSTALKSYGSSIDNSISKLEALMED